MRKFCTLALALFSVAAFGQGFDYRPSREFRSMNTAVYEVSVQKNGRTDVSLISGAVVFDNAYPMVELEGEEGPQPLPVSGVLTERQPVNNALGVGNSFVFRKNSCEWVIQSFPAQPFFTVQVAYVNTGKKPVKVKALYPFAVGDPVKGSVSLGASMAETIVLDNGPLTQQEVEFRKLGTSAVASQWYLPALNPVSRRMLVAGFLTSFRSQTYVRLARTETSAEDKAEVFQGQCVYDPPIEVPPGERLESEVFYVSVGEDQPLDALERFGWAVAAFGGHKPRRATLPHGWDPWNSRYHTDISEDSMLAELEFVDKNLKRYGWTHFSLDDGWQIARGNWEPDPAKFPHGMKAFVDQVHARGMTAGIWTDPFTIDIDTPLAKEHPDWLLEVAGLGKELVGEDQRLLDVTRPEAYQYVVALYRKIGVEWGFDALVEADFVYRLLFAEGYAQKNLTHVEVFRVGMRAVQEGFGEDAGKFLMSMPPMAINGPMVDGMRIGNDCAPIWRRSPDRWPWGCVETLNNAAHRYFFAPNLWAPDQDCAYFNHATERARWGVTGEPDLTIEQSVAWLTGAALTGGIIKIGNAFSDLKPNEVAVLRRLLPVSSMPARPVDIFERAQPAIWTLPIESKIGNWQIVAVFNWDTAAPATVPVLVASLGLAERRRYTVYDFWGDMFYGTAQDNLDVTVGPGAVRLLGLRPYEDRPMFLSTDRHWSMGATDFKELTWDETSRTLSGMFTGTADTDYRLRVLVPPPYKFSQLQVSAGPATGEMDPEGKVLLIGFKCQQPGEVKWTATFAR